MGSFMRFRCIDFSLNDVISAIIIPYGRLGEISPSRFGNGTFILASFRQAPASPFGPAVRPKAPQSKCPRQSLPNGARSGRFPPPGAALAWRSAALETTRKARRSCGLPKDRPTSSCCQSNRRSRNIHSRLSRCALSPQLRRIKPEVFRPQQPRGTTRT